MNRDTDKHKHMIETKGLLKKGIKSGAIKSEDDVLFLGKDWNRVCAPEASLSKKMFSVILWNKSKPSDQVGWGREVSGYFLYWPKIT
jgi:hypothetical protein